MKLNLKIDKADFKKKLDIKDGKTPVAGVDFPIPKDGEPGKSVKGDDGYTPIKGVDYFDGKDGSPDTALEVKNKLESLTKDDRLDIKAIKGVGKLKTDISNHATEQARGILYAGLLENNSGDGGMTLAKSGSTPLTGAVTLTGSGDVTLSQVGQNIDINATFTPIFSAGSVIFSNGTDLTEDNANFFWDDTNNRLGIGTTTPATALDVIGAGQFSTNVTIKGVAGSGLYFGDATTYGHYSGVYGSNGGNDINIKGYASSTIHLGFGTSTGQDLTALEAMTIKSTGNVGINNTAPAERLDILGNALLTKTGTATVGTQTYNSNEYKLQGSQWFTSGSVAKTLTGGMTIKPRNPGAIVTSTLDFGYAIDSSTERPVISYKVGDHYNDGYAGQLTLRSGYWDGLGSFATGYGSSFGGTMETQYDGTFAFRPVGASGTNFSGIRALSFGTHPVYASFWARWGYGGGSSYDADIRVSFNGAVNIGAGQPAWYTPSPGAGATGSELLNVTIGSQIINNLTSRQTLLIKNIASQTADSLVIQNSSATVLTRFDVNGYLGIGVAPTAYLHLKAGTATASTAPLKFTSGTLNTTAEAGAVEFLTDKFYGTITTGAARKELTLNDAALTSGRVPFVTTNGRLTDDADFTFATDTLTVSKTRTTRIKGTSSAPSIAGGSGAGASPTVSITGTDLAGEITVTTDADPTTSAVFCTVTFTSAFGTAPYVVFAPSNDNSANAYRNGEPLYVNSSTTTFTLNTNSVASPQGSTEYKYTYQVIE